MRTVRMEKFRDITTLTILIIFLYQEVGTAHTGKVFEFDIGPGKQLNFQNFKLSSKIGISLKMTLKPLKIIQNNDTLIYA